MKTLNKILLTGLAVLSIAMPAFAEKIVVTGSTTVLPLSQKAAEVFMQNNPNADISIRGGGSGVGIASIIDGSCDIANSSRPIRDVELQKGASNGRDIKAHIVAMDGIAIVVHPSNGISALTKSQVRDIYTGKISNWSQVGGKNEKIVAISRDTSSGTFEAFMELVLDKQKVRPDAIMQASNQAIATTVARTPNAIGYVGLGFLSGDIKAVTIDGVMPSKETVLLGKYKVGRPLFMYTNGAPKGLAKDYLDFIKSAQGQSIADELGYVGLK
ncbi:MAG TPA: PstS family phosphate ABC transporter substrate-binding protein [Candidatus Omnitrophota bacterium]|nr:PstS family phosphate ABC transporter substrate-binding protein [Candidatus Omnitrophota bacterium]